jgi:hypothetical protein
MHRVGFEPTTPVLERVKTVHALHRAATVMAEVHNGGATYPPTHTFSWRGALLSENMDKYVFILH